VFGQVAFCAGSSTELYSGVAGADTDYERGFVAAPDTVWAKERDSANTSYHYRCWLNTAWNCGGYWSGYPLGVRCVVALKKSSIKTFIQNLK